MPLWRCMFSVSLQQCYGAFPALDANEAVKFS